MTNHLSPPKGPTIGDRHLPNGAATSGRAVFPDTPGAENAHPRTLTAWGEFSTMTTVFIISAPSDRHRTLTVREGTRQ